MFNLRPLALEEKKKGEEENFISRVSCQFLSVIKNEILPTKRGKGFVLEILSWREMKYNETVKKRLEKLKLVNNCS